jgi:UDP-N-acetylmuramoyl-tripeptide--D-alanyl-D-alanine ligase
MRISVAGQWCTSVSVDTRTLQPGALFVALKGPNHDGHDFVAAAFEKGAAAAVVERPVEAPGPLHVVPDALAWLQQKAAEERSRWGGLVVGITGSAGKTTTKEALAAVLSVRLRTGKTQGNFNNHIGVPLTILNLPDDAEAAAVEIGMNHAGEIRALVPLARPAVAVITAIAPAHIGNFADGIEGIARAKAEILEGLEPGGTAVLPADTPQFPILLEAAERAGVARIVTFGEAASADWRLRAVELGPKGSTVEAERAGRIRRFRLGAPGRHWASNALAVLAAVEALGADLDRAAAELADFAPPSGRGRQRRLRWRDGEILLLDESYNANPASMAAAIALLGLQAGRRIAVLGDMLELGEGAEAMHAALAEPLRAATVARVFTCGPLMAALDRALPASMRGPHAADSAALAPLVVDELQPGDVVLVKGSLGSRMARVIEALEASARS